MELKKIMKRIQILTKEKLPSFDSLEYQISFDVEKIFDLI